MIDRLVWVKRGTNDTLVWVEDEGRDVRTVFLYTPERRENPLETWERVRRRFHQLRGRGEAAA